MFWIFLILVIVLFIFWLLLSPMELHIDTRVPQATFRWLTIGRAVMIYEKEEWFLKVKILLFKKQWPLSRIFVEFAGRKKKPKKIAGKKATPAFRWKQRLPGILSTFRITELLVAIDGLDQVGFAMMYPLNFMPYVGKHIRINFEDQTYFLLRVRNQPMRLLYALIR